MTRARELSRRSLRLRGLVAVALAVALAVGIAAVVITTPFSGDDGMVQFSITAPSVPDGIQEGIPVDVRGETIGTVCGLDISRTDETRLDLCVRQSEMGELTQDAAVSFVSRNLFGSDALRLTPDDAGSGVRAGSVIALSQAPADYTMTATVRSAGSFTLPVLTPELSDLLKQVSDTSIRLAPFLTAATITLQTMQRGQTVRLRTLLPTMADALDGMGVAGAGTVSGFENAMTTPNFADHAYVNRVLSMIGDIGDLFGGLGTLFNGMIGFGSVLDLVTAFASPLNTAFRGVTPGQVSTLLDHANGAFHTDPTTGKMVLSTEVNLDLVPAVSNPLSALVSGGGR